METRETQILKEQKELEDKKEIIELKEVCVCEHVCESGHSLQHGIKRITNHLLSYICLCVSLSVCVCVCNKAEKAGLISIPDQILKEIERKRSKRE